jgi:hypothetical protein
VGGVEDTRVLMERCGGARMDNGGGAERWRACIASMGVAAQ